MSEKATQQDVKVKGSEILVSTEEKEEIISNNPVAPGTNIVTRGGECIPVADTKL